MADSPRLAAYGGRDMIDSLEALLAKVRAGEVDGIALGYVQRDGQNHFFNFAWRDDAALTAARLGYLCADMARACLSDEGL